MVRKIFRTLLSQYTIRVSAIQELRFLGKVNVSLHSLIRMLTAFELSNYDNSVPKIDVVSKASMMVAWTRRRKETGSSSTIRTSHSHENDTLLSEE